MRTAADLDVSVHPTHSQLAAHVKSSTRAAYLEIRVVLEGTAWSRLTSGSSNQVKQHVAELENLVKNKVLSGLEDNADRRNAKMHYDAAQSNQTIFMDVEMKLSTGLPP